MIFLRKWQEHHDHRQSCWEEIDINDDIIAQSEEIAHEHWHHLYSSPIGVSHHYLNEMSQSDWERIRKACIITLGHQAINAVRMVARELFMGRINVYV